MVQPHRAPQQRCSHASLLRLTAAACLLLIAKAQDTTPIFDLHSRSPYFGPATSLGIAWGDVNAFLDNGRISRVAFRASVGDSSGLTVWYNQARVVRGESVSTSWSEAVGGEIVQFVAQWLDPTTTAPGRFVSWSFTMRDGSQITLGMPNGAARQFSATAPYNTFLGCFEGKTLDGKLTALRAVWFTYGSMATPYRFGVTNFIVASPVRADLFDDTADALRQGRITRIAAQLGPQPAVGQPMTGMLVWFNDLTRRYGASSVINISTAQRITSKIARITGSYISANNGYFAHMTFMATNGMNWTIGVPSTNSSARTFDVRAPAGAYLGAFRGYHTATTIRQIAFVWFKDSR